MTNKTKQPPVTGKTVEQQSLKKLPPHDFEAEQCVLSAIFWDDTPGHEYYWQAREVLTNGAEEFYRPSHQIIFTAMTALVNAESRVDLGLVRDELVKTQQLDAIGGPVYLAALMDVMPTAANIAYHARIVHRKYRRRQVTNASLETAFQGLDNSGDDEEYVAQAVRRLTELSEEPTREWTTLETLAAPMYEELSEQAATPGQLRGVPTGYPDLDDYLLGLQPGDVTILAARPSVGKTALALSIAHNLIRRQTDPLRVGMFSLEMPRRQLYLRLLAMEAQVNLEHLRMPERLFGDEWERMAAATESLKRFPLFIDDTPGLTPPLMRAKAKSLVRRQDVDLLIVDYLQLMAVTPKMANRNLEIGEISRSLKILAKDLNVPVICLSQLNRENEREGNRRPRMSDLRDSGCVEQDADNVLLLHRPDPERLSEIECHIAKQRNGRIGLVYLTFLGDYTRFESAASPSCTPPTATTKGDAWYATQPE